MSGHLEAMNAQKAKDQKLSTLLSNIRTFLPSVNREGDTHFDSDFLPHPATLAHLRRRFNFVSSQLLRNDSLTDMSDRSVLYFELFEWLEVFPFSAISAKRLILSDLRRQFLDMRHSQA